MVLDKVSNKQIKTIENNLNNKSRKVLGHQTPLEVNSRLATLHFVVEPTTNKKVLRLSRPYVNLIEYNLNLINNMVCRTSYAGSSL